MKNVVLFYQNSQLFCLIDSSSRVRGEIGLLTVPVHAW